jgi:hypothetical protein
MEWNSILSRGESSSPGTVDLLKVEAYDEKERMLLYSMLDNGFRPGILLIKYTVDPDANVPSMLVAGHLQLSGYCLLSTNNNWFLYVYTDMRHYDSCVWRDVTVQNPLIRYIVELFDTKQRAAATQAQPETKGATVGEQVLENVEA